MGFGRFRKETLPSHNTECTDRMAVHGHLMLRAGGSPLYRWLGGLLSPAGRRSRLSILIYHRVLPKADPLLPTEVDAKTFTWHMETLKEHFNILSLADAVEALSEGTLPARAACVTFDDGYADNVEMALPILRRLGLPATFFLATGFLNGGRMWNDSVIETVRATSEPLLDLREAGLGEYPIRTVEEKRRAIADILSKLKYREPREREERVEVMTGVVGNPLSRTLMMRTDQVRELVEAGMEIGGHTVNHPILSSISIRRAKKEIAEGKETLEELTGRPVRLFAYPNGVPDIDYTFAHVDTVRALGFQAAVSTAWGAATGESDRYQLPRFTPWDTRPGRFVLRLLSNCRRQLVALG